MVSSWPWLLELKQSEKYFLSIPYSKACLHQPRQCLWVLWLRDCDFIYNQIPCLFFLLTVYATLSVNKTVYRYMYLTVVDPCIIITKRSVFPETHLRPFFRKTFKTINPVVTLLRMLLKIWHLQRALAMYVTWLNSHQPCDIHVRLYEQQPVTQCNSEQCGARSVVQLAISAF